MTGDPISRLMRGEDVTEIDVDARTGRPVSEERIRALVASHEALVWILGSPEIRCYADALNKGEIKVRRSPNHRHESPGGADMNCWLGEAREATE